MTDADGSRYFAGMTNAAQLDTIGKRLLPHVPKRGRQALEKAAGLSPGYLTKILGDEVQNPGREKIQAICEVLELDFEWIYFGRGSSPLTDDGGAPLQAGTPGYIWQEFAERSPDFAAIAFIAKDQGASDALLDAVAVQFSDRGGMSPRDIEDALAEAVATAKRIKEILEG